jgi:hypothetical protein
MNGRNSDFWILKFQCNHHVANEISYKTFDMDFVVFVGCAYGGQYHLNKYEKYQKNVKKYNSEHFDF